jgi:hypothetical protein
MGLAAARALYDFGLRYQIVEAMIGPWQARLVVTTDGHLDDEERQTVKDAVERFRPAGALVDIVFEEFVV